MFCFNTLIVLSPCLCIGTVGGVTIHYTNASSYYKCAATIRAPSWCRPPRVAPPPAVTVYRANPTDSARSSNLAGAGAHATKKKVSQTAYSLCTTLFVKYDSAVDSMRRCSNHDFLDLLRTLHACAMACALE